MNFFLFLFCMFVCRLFFRLTKTLVILGIGAWLLFDAGKEHPDLVRAFWQTTGALAHKVGEWAQEYQDSDFLNHEQHHP